MSASSPRNEVAVDVPHQSLATLAASLGQHADEGRLELKLKGRIAAKTDVGISFYFPDGTLALRVSGRVLASRLATTEACETAFVTIEPATYEGPAATKLRQLVDRPFARTEQSAEITLRIETNYDWGAVDL